MQKSAIRHNYSTAFRAAKSLKRLQIRLRTARGDLNEAQILYGKRFNSDKDPKMAKVMEKVASSELYDYFQAEISLSSGRFSYYFFLKDINDNIFWYTEKGLTKVRPKGWKLGYFQYPIIKEEDIWQAPQWARDAVFYQIFPERFNRTKVKGRTKNGQEIQPWGSKPRREAFMGGDLKGIKNKLNYLQDLGVDALYLTPVFKSPSNHKYNITDYYKIDEDLGTEKEAQELVEAAQDKDIKVIFDAVLNHCGSNFFAFQDVLQRGENSKYKDWFYINEFPVSLEDCNYETFAQNIPQMPRLNMHNREVQEYFLDFAEYWTEKLNLDGWRLDVADEVPRSFWREFRQRVKDVNPKAFIIGEVWYDATDWLNGDQFDSIMNYHLMYDILDYLAAEKISLTQLTDRITENIFRYRPEASNFLLNLLGSHDTPRLKWHFRNFKEEKRRKKINLAVALQFFLPGIPMIFYGDELGLTGKDDPDCRRAMPWKPEEQDLPKKNFYKNIIKTYKQRKLLKSGNYREVFVDEVAEVLIFSRAIEDKTLYLAFNFSENEYKLDESVKNKIRGDFKEDFTVKKEVIPPLSYLFL